MVTISLFCESRYPANRKSIKKTVEEFLGQQGIGEDTVVSISIIGDRKMRALNNKYRNLDKTTNVLSFSQVEGEGIKPPDGKLHLGDIVISYPEAVKGAGKNDRLVDDEINMLITHSLNHLLGIHHE